MPARKVITLHAPMARQTADRILAPTIEMMEAFGFKWWLNTDDLPNLVLMIQSPEEWCERGPTTAELDYFYELYNDGRMEEAREFARSGGFPPYLR